MDDRFLDVLTKCAPDYALEISLGAFAIPEFMTTDCDMDDIEDCVVSHVRAHVAEVAAANTPDASVGAVLTFDSLAGRAYVHFKDIFIGGVEYPSMSILKESGDMDAMAPALRDKVHALIRRYHDAVQGAVDAAGRDFAWLPAAYADFASHYADESYADWEEVHWFAHERDPDLLTWLEDHPFRKRKAWCAHPCNGALVIAMESADDAQALERWLGTE